MAAAPLDAVVEGGGHDGLAAAAPVGEVLARHPVPVRPFSSWQSRANHFRCGDHPVDCEGEDAERAEGVADPGTQAEGRPRQPLAFSTLDLPPWQQFDAWQASSAGTVEVTPLADPAAGFPAERAVWALGPMALMTMRAPAARLVRTAAAARRSSLDHWMITIALRGERRIRTDAGCLTIPAGVASIASMNDVFDSDRSDIDWLCLCLPRDLAPEIATALNASRDTPLDTSMGRILASFLLQLAAEIPSLGEAEQARVVESTRAIVAASIAPSAEAMAAAQAQIDLVQLSRVKVIIRQHLRSAILTAERLSRLAGVSRSQLYRLFEHQGGVARYIQSERLRAACRALAAPEGERDISAIAEDVGFFDPSAFSRAFRREFGVSPREFRAAALAGQAVVQRRGALKPDTTDLADFLGRL
ncbi:helix-turn-helix domain-containing protein [Falsiroseomonas sp. E2-1-a20]|uniref:helix-turn-helix domain-containing protein n=1 Tax=Falsiroseomonas sp. E2-1-a20 TaxID=3239300 RepID=UPI003F2B829B